MNMAKFGRQEMSRSTFKQVVIELEKIASGNCQCTQDGDDVCQICKASRILNRMSADAHDSLEELNAE